ncbi:olfactory receptor 5I1-like [Xenopus laevis]|uniref:Olfactory receptor n=1 Tax=Xenopus laevis TaxID=8355 RepID=A0A8J1MGP7_XENLA|nr:olfactory receptor 5I1-like [Xenopus laevis]
MGNKTAPVEFILKDFSDEPSYQTLTFTVFLVVFLTALVNNVLITVVIIQTPALWTPMYFFIGNLGILDTCYISTIVPRLLVSSLAQNKKITFGGCLVQLYFFFKLSVTESTILAAMSYDRYMAICNPLHYMVVMNKKVCMQLAMISWMNGIAYSTIQTAIVYSLDFCKSNIVDHFFCDIPPLLHISCSGTKIVEIIVILLGSVLVLPSFLFIVISYFYIVRTILRIPSATGRRKTFSTCVSHLINVSLFYLAGTSVYTRPAPRSSDLLQIKISAVFYTVFVPLVNPAIYSLRNCELKGSIRKNFNRITGIFLLKVLHSFPLKGFAIKK